MSGSVSSLTQEELKKIVGCKAVDDYVRSDMVVGLGTGSTVTYSVERLGQLLAAGTLQNIICVPTSEATRLQASKLNIPLCTLNEKSRLDVTIDGADCVDPSLNLIKGQGGALLREKLVETASNKFICIVDESKLGSGPGPKFPIPVEIIPFCHLHTLRILEALPSFRECGGRARLRTGHVGNNKCEGENIAITDNGNYIADLYFEKPLLDMTRLAHELLSTVGVVEHGIFVGMASTVMVATRLQGVRVAGEGGEKPWCGPLTSIPSTWRQVKVTTSECQTDESLYKFDEHETQTGTQTEIIGDEVKEKYTGMSVLEFMSKKHKRMDKETWRKGIEGGRLTVTDAEACIVQTNPESKIKGEDFIEYVCVSCEAGTQTLNGSSGAGISKTAFTEAESKNMGQDGEFKAESKGSAGGDSAILSDKVSEFLKRAAPLVEDMLRENVTSTAFDGYEDRMGMSSADAGEIRYWNKLSVDLERKKVVYPDWGKARHCPGRILRQVLTRNRERIYDVEFEDSSKVQGIREEHIRIVGDNVSGAAIASSKTQAAPLLAEGIRVHCIAKSRNGKGAALKGPPKGLPGRIVKVHRAGTYDVECEGGNVFTEVPPSDLVVGLSEGQTVEARKPVSIQLQGTGVSWNATGASLAVSYGLDNITGWCDSPGALCVWNVFGRAFNPAEPDFTLDHPSCLMCAQFHPVLPSIVAAGSFNGEVVIWDLNGIDQTSTVSPIAEYAHKEPVMSLQWVKEGTASSGEDTWLLASAGSDGRVLFWSVANSIKHPVLGTVLSKTQRSGRRVFPAAYGATALAFSGGIGALSRPLWMMAGTETGGLVRGQAARIFSSPRLSKDSLQSQTGALDKGDEREKGDGVYPPLRRANEVFSHEAHIGAVTAIDFSPFSRNLFLSCGSDGTLRLSHLLESSPLRIWEPAPAPGTPGVGSEPFSPLSCARFSPTRPLVFATASAAGFIYLFDLSVQSTGPVAALEVPAGKEADAAMDDNKAKPRKDRSTERRRTGFSSLAFNRKQRGMLAACDYKGGVHIWRLGWSFTSKRPDETSALEQMDGGGGQQFSFD